MEGHRRRCFLHIDELSGPRRPRLLSHGLGDDSVLAAHSLLPRSGKIHVASQDAGAENLPLA